ncbi:hypothetical protein ACF07Q_28685 [Nocardiopsis dassonvillei]|uniref:hypothetical protein n=1 Tax=Nocardiopsis dassonvillei TaxID=2014 RepID=UPI0036FE3DA9
MADPTPLPTPDARARLDALLGKQVCATVTRGLGHSVETIRGELAAEGNLYVARRATVRYPDADVHVDHMQLVAVDETEPSPETIADAVRIAHDAIMHRTDGDIELADLIARGIRDAYRTGWHRALAGHEDAPELEPVTARWNRLTVRDDDGTTWVLCTTDPGQSVALALDEEHAEALAGSLLGTEDGEEVETAEDRASLRDRIASTLYTPPDPYTVPARARAQDVALHQADAVMDVLANRIDTPADGWDPRTEVEAHWGGDPERLIAGWEADQAQQRRRIAELETARDLALAVEDEQAAEITDLRAQLAAATWPSRAARPTTERSGQ